MKGFSLDNFIKPKKNLTWVGISFKMDPYMVIHIMLVNLKMLAAID